MSWNLFIWGTAITIPNSYSSEDCPACEPYEDDQVIRMGGCVMEKLRWYFKNGTKFEEYSVLYSDDSFILVQNDNTKKYSYGLRRDFGTLCGFPVNQSCLTTDEVKEMLSVCRYR